METGGIISLISVIRDKANKLILSELKKRDIHGLVTSHGDILFALFKARELTMKEITDKISKDKSTVTTLVNKLVYEGYVKTKKDPLDNRVTLVSLTEKGEKLKTDFDFISNKLLSTVYKGFSENDKEILIQLLQKIRNNLEV